MSNNNQKFLETAKPLVLRSEDDGVILALNPRQFSSGSVGFFASGKVDVQGHRCQATVSVTVIGSKPAAAPASPPPPAKPKR